MRILTAAAVIAVAVAMAIAVPVRAAKPPGVTKCVAPTAQLNSAATSVMASGGKCTQGTAAVKAVVSYQYQKFDQKKNPCGGVSAGGGTKLPLSVSTLPSYVNVRFGVAPRSAPKKVIWAKWKNYALAGSSLQCGKLTASTALPAQSQLCAWDDSGLSISYTTEGGACGVPIASSSAWAGPATLSNHEVIAGPVASPGGPCQYGTDHAPVTWFTPDPIFIAWGLKCPSPDDAMEGAIVGLKEIRLGHYDANHQFVADCKADPDGIAVTRFNIPPSWTGVLQVDFFLIPVHGGKVMRQFESQTSQFDLSPGMPNGCPLSLAPING